MKKYFVSMFYMCTALFAGMPHAHAQNADSTASWSLSAYADVYYARYSDSVGVGNFQKFPTVSPRSNSFGINAVQVSAQYDGAKIRGTFIVQAGDIPISSWSSKYNAIQEAHIGIKLCNKLWLDGGFFKTHFGTEYLMPKDNITSSLAMLTYYEPFYESGLRLNYDPTNKVEINMFLLNGYNMFDDNNRKKSLGLGITWLLGKNGNIGYTNYIGDDSPDGTPVSHTRFANNLFFNYAFGAKFTVQAGADFFIQQNSSLTDPAKPGIAYGMLATAKYQIRPKIAVYERTDMFFDADGFLSSIYSYGNGYVVGYQSIGETAGLEYKPSANSYIRLEYRRIQMFEQEAVFRENGSNLDYSNELAINMGLYFDLLKSSDNKK